MQTTSPPAARDALAGRLLRRRPAPGPDRPPSCGVTVQRLAVALVALALAACAGSSSPAPLAPALDAPAPDAPAPDAPAPDAPAPDAPAPDAPAPDAPALDAPAPDAPALDAPAPDAPAPDASRRRVAVSAYYAGWMQDAVPPGVIDFPSLTQIHHFSLVPRADGTVDGTENGLTPAHARALVAAAHAAGRPVLVSVGGADTAAGFRGAWADGRRGDFVAAIVRFVTAFGYDGVDVDVEPLEASDAAGFQRFVRALRSALDAARPGLQLTAAAGGAPAAYPPIQSLFTQINVMTYDLAGPWPGWVTWHNTALESGGQTFPSTGGALPSVASSLAPFLAAGIDRARLGLGVDFYGYDWRGASGPLQAIRGVTVRTLSYAALMDSLWRPDRARWDAVAQVPWLAVDAPGTADDHFVSYDDERSAVAKVEHARREGLGSVILWELGGGWRSTQPAGRRDALLRAVGQAALR